MVKRKLREVNETLSLCNRRGRPSASKSTKYTEQNLAKTWLDIYIIAAMLLYLYAVAVGDY